MKARRDAAVRSLRVAMVASIVVPVAIFCWGAWVTFNNEYVRADEQLNAKMDVLAEQANTVFDSVSLTFTSVNAIVERMTDSEIEASARKLHQKLREIEAATEAVAAIRIVDARGRPLVGSQAFPVAENQNISERDYFKAQVAKDAGTVIGSIVEPRFSKGRYFGVSRRRPSQNGQFAGIVVVSISPAVFNKFYARLAKDGGGNYVLLKASGDILVRYPASPEGVTKVNPHGGFMNVLATNPAGGITTSRHTVDGIDRRVGIRKLAIDGLYVSAGIELRKIYAAWLWGLATYLMFGFPAAALFVVLISITLRRTKDFFDQVQQRELAEESLRQSQKMEAVGQLTGGVAHDFNNLLTIISGNIDRAKRGVSDPRAERALDYALVGAERAAQLTKRLLAFSRRQPLDPRPIDPNRLVAGLADLLKRTLTEKVDLETISGAGLWTVEADAAELEAAILNLALNARDAMPDGGKLTIEVSNAYLDDAYCRKYADLSPGQYVVIAVSDNGEGMSQDIVDKATEPFFTTKEAGKGTGLGLSQVYGFAKQSGGHFKIYSEVAVGTTVKLYLPRYKGDEKPTTDDAIVASERGRGETILLVEDDDGVRRYVAEILRDLNYNVLEAHDSTSALNLLDENRAFDLLLTDVVLPGQSGRDLANEIERRRQSIKVIFMTGYSRNAIVHHGRLDRGTELISKPFTEEQLAERVRRVLDDA
jgi:two-component system NtrC family sensor kinase